MKNFLTYSVLSFLMFLFAAPAFAGQAGPVPPTPTATADWDQMEEMVDAKWQKKLVRKLEKQEEKAIKKGKVAQGGRSYIVALLLAIFLGYLGVDRFYLGYPGWGLIKLFTGGLAGIMWIIDIILIALGIVGPKNGRYTDA